MLFTRIYQLIQVLTLSVGLCSLVLIVIAPVPETIPRRGRAQRHVARYRSGLKAGIGWEKRAEYAEEVKELWTWGFHQYMTWAYPAVSWNRHRKRRHSADLTAAGCTQADHLQGRKPGSQQSKQLRCQ